MLLRSHVSVRKPFLVATLALALLLATAVMTALVDFASANPYSKAMYSGDVSPPLGTKPPVISVVSPENNSTYNTNDISLTFNVSAGQSNTGISKIFFSGHWHQNTTYVNFTAFNNSLPPQLSYNLTGVPDGNQSITICAVATGTYYGDLFHYYRFYISNAVLVNFVIDTTPPEVTVLAVENKTASPSDAAFNFTVNEPFTRATYSLDGQENATTSGNITLTGLADDAHTLTVYAQDAAGNIGASETITFNTAKEQETSPTTLVAAVIISVAALTAGLTVYFKKHNHLFRKTADR
jgi:hypothetical protein